MATAVASNIAAQREDFWVGIFMAFILSFGFFLAGFFVVVLSLDVRSSVCLPDERQINLPGSRTAIMDKDRVRAGHLDVHLVESLDVHDVGSRYVSESLGDARAGSRFQADPFDADTWEM
jgi:hypothetical protein